jgi:hypothetical protein
MSKYFCNLITPIKIQVNVNGSWTYQEVEKVYFKEPSINEIRVKFDKVRPLAKKLFLEISQMQKAVQEQKTVQQEKEKPQTELQYEEVLEQGLGMIEAMEISIDTFPLFMQAFKEFIGNGTVFVDPAMQTSLTSANILLIDAENFDNILAMYLGYFTPFFMSRNPKKSIA